MGTLAQSRWVAHMLSRGIRYENSSTVEMDTDGIGDTPKHYFAEILDLNNPTITSSNSCNE